MWIELQNKEVKDLYRQGGLDARPVEKATPAEHKRMQRQLSKRSGAPRGRPVRKRGKR
jgi:hypothetical protein